jgi:TolB protein
MRYRAWMTGVGALALLTGVEAADIEIVKAGAIKTAIDLGGLRAEGGAGQVFVSVLREDLVRSGWFTAAEPGRGAVAVQGTASGTAGRLDVDCDVINRARGARYLAYRESGPVDAARRLAHRCADRIVEAVRGKTGIASTRIAMVGNIEGHRDIFICDADGHGVLRVTRDAAVCLSPAWSPNADALYYTSLHQGFPDVYRIDLAAGRRERVAGFPGLNAGADVSPDGRTIVLTLSRDGNPELYAQDLRGKQLTRLTRTRHAAEASPSWSPDSNRIVFVSDRSGSPQLYVMSRAGGEQTRLTYRGSENVAPDWGPAGIVYCSRRDGRYRICVLDPATRADRCLTEDGADYEEPSWAPDERHVACTRTVAYQSAIYILDTLGDAPVRLTAISGNWYSPAWSPR